MSEGHSKDLKTGLRETHVTVLIPALNEERAIGSVLQEIPEWTNDVMVVDNGSTDRTAEVAADHGARVVHEPEAGYGAACLAGIDAIQQTDVLVFMDGDYSDRPEEMDRVVEPILADGTDLVIGSRTKGEADPGSLSPQARFGNALACSLIQVIWRHSYSDLGPFRAVRWEALKTLKMCDQDYGWTVEMQIKAIREGLDVREVPVSYRNRIGQSKISGTVKGVILAGCKILGTILWHALSRDSLKENMLKSNP